MLSISKAESSSEEHTDNPVFLMFIKIWYILGGDVEAECWPRLG
jgi:hypothetical protein